MRHLFTILLLLAMVVSCRQSTEVVPLAEPVASLADLPAIYQPFDGGSTIAGRLKSQTTAGRPSGEWHYDLRGKLLEQRLYIQGQAVSADQYRYDQQGHLRFVQHFGNNCEWSSAFPCGGPLRWLTYVDITTDGAGRMIESRPYHQQDGQWVSNTFTTYTYDAEGQLIQSVQYDNMRKPSLTQTFSYDSQGNVIRVDEQNQVAGANQALTYTYDRARNPYRHTVYFASAFFLSAYLQTAPGTTYAYRPDGQPSRIQEPGGVSELTYY